MYKRTDFGAEFYLPCIYTNKQDIELAFNCQGLLEVYILYFVF